MPSNALALMSNTIIIMPQRSCGPVRAPAPLHYCHEARAPCASGPQGGVMAHTLARMRGGGLPTYHLLDLVDPRY